jgi:hypothetical protein
VISRNPATIQLRYLQTLSEIGVNQNSTVVFPLPMNLIGPVADAVAKVTQEGKTAPGELPPGNGTGDMGKLAPSREAEEAETGER